VLKRIVQQSGVTREDCVLEIGAGLGSLTRLLAEAAGEVKAVEIDGRLIPALREVVGGYSNVEIIQGDILEMDAGKLAGRAGYGVVANIPYYITSAIIRHLLENPIKPGWMVLTMQREVAERICAQPGDLSLLALSVQVYGTPVILGVIPAQAFYPVPGVDSATLRIDLYPQSIFTDEQRSRFFTLIRMAFAQKRKMLRNNLAAGLHLSTKQVSGYLLAAGIDPERRAQTLNLVEWKTLVNELGELIPVEGGTGVRNVEQRAA